MVVSFLPKVEGASEGTLTVKTDSEQRTVKLSATVDPRTLDPRTFDGSVE
jgi:hypothetical protein